ncbi:hypothetical protein MPSEU_000263900 [Mayamaea pseudoterrestris]|nr:hypothetical protein MPSEU_000263900 [Mayamaea pseudoterrestris]
MNVVKTLSSFELETNSMSSAASNDAYSLSQDELKHELCTRLVPLDAHDDATERRLKVAAEASHHPSAAASPSCYQLFSFQSTVTLVWLVEPLLSLTDATVVSWTAYNAVMQVAAMGPATTLMDTLLYMVYFLATATTNQLAALSSEVNSYSHGANNHYDASRRRRNLFRKLQSTTSRFMGLAVCAGCFILIIVWTIGDKLLLLFTNDEELVSLAVQYCRIRALMAPVAILGMVAQSVCLVTHHTVTVRYAIAFAVTSNCLCDALLTPILGMQGAAMAKMAANGSEAFVLLRRVRLLMQEWKRQEEEEIFNYAEVNMESKPIYAEAHVPFLSLPNGPSLKQMLKLSLPLAFVMWARMGTYCVLTMRLARLNDVASLAAHSILLRVYYLLGCLADGLGQTAQNYLPTVLYPKLQVTQYESMLMRMALLCLFASMAGGIGAHVLLSKATSSFFVSDETVAFAIGSTGPVVAACLALHALSTLMEGVMIAKRDFRNLVVTYSVTFSAHLIILLRCNDLHGIWSSLVWWQVSRIVNFGACRRRGGIVSND